MTATNTYKPKSQFASLPEADRKLILDLCSKNPYDHVVELLRRPRAEGGLSIRTSRSALSRFYTTAQPDPDHALLAQIAVAANIRHEQDSNAFLGAIRAIIQARVLEHLRTGRALADMQHDFKLLRTAENLYLADASFRAKHPKAARAAYRDHVQHCADAPDSDFTPADDCPSEPNENPPQDLTPFERDILKERERQLEILNFRISANAQREQQNLLENARLGALGLTPRPAVSVPSHIPPGNPLKTPVIPHFPPNPTSETIPPANPQNQQNGAPPKRVPYVAPPKVGRNEPCPCGSGRKAKKCCHRSI
jgi:hypothetical protein